MERSPFTTRPGPISTVDRKNKYRGAQRAPLFLFHHAGRRVEYFDDSLLHIDVHPLAHGKHELGKVPVVARHADPDGYFFAEKVIVNKPLYIVKIAVLYLGETGEDHAAQQRKAVDMSDVPYQYLEDSFDSLTSSSTRIASFKEPRYSVPWSAWKSERFAGINLPVIDPGITGVET